MKIEIVPEKVDNAGLDILELSRMLRRAREEVDEARLQLRCCSQLEECRYALQKQEDALSLSTANCVKLACSLREIAQIYRQTETKSISRLEERPSARGEKGSFIIFGGGYGLDRRVQNILNQ